MARSKKAPNAPVTLKALDEVVQAILAGTEGLINELRWEMKSRFEHVDHRLDNLVVGQSHLKDQINGLKANLSDTARRREFQELKSKVDRHHPTHG